MNPALWISKTGIQAQDARLQAIANNLANVNTVGFKRDRMVFEDLFYQEERQPGGKVAGNATAPVGTQLGNGTRLVGTQKVFTTGNIQSTGQSLDIAIMGKGFLQVQQDNGEIAYTRAGQLQVNSDGNLVTPQGLLIQPNINVPSDASSITISESGVVTVTTGSDSEPTNIGQITLAQFVNPAGLVALGDNLYTASAASGEASIGNPGEDSLGKIKQGALEGSNVQAVEEMVDMITAQRTYEMNTKVLSAADNMMQYLSQAVR